MLAIRVRSATLFTDMDAKQLQVEYDTGKKAEITYLKIEKKLTEMLVGKDTSELERSLIKDISSDGKKVLPDTADTLQLALDAGTVAAVLTLSNRARAGRNCIAYQSNRADRFAACNQ